MATEATTPQVGAPSPQGQRRRDPWPVAVGLVAVAVYALHGLAGPLTRDLALYAYAGQQVVEGRPPYVGVFNRAGPLAHLLPGVGAALARLLGTDDLLTMRVCYLLLAAGCIVVTYGVARDLVGSRGAGVLAATSLLCFESFLHFAAYGPRDKTPMSLFMLVAFWAVVHRRWAWAGAWVALATLTVQIAFFATAPALLVASLWQPRGRWAPSVARIAVGGLVPAALASLCFWLVGAFGAFLDGFVLVNARYTPNQEFGLGRSWPDLVTYLGPSLVVALVGLAGLLLAGVLALALPRLRHEPQTPVLVALLTGTLGGLFWSWRDFDGLSDTLIVLPGAALGTAALIWLLRCTLPAPVGVVVQTTSAAICLVLAVTYSATTRSDRATDQRAAVAACLEVLPDGASMAAINAPQPLVLAGLTNPTDIQSTGNGIEDYIEDRPGGLEGFLATTKAAEPSMIAVGTPATETWIRRLGPEYVRVGRGPGWQWMADASLDEQTLADLRGVVEDRHDGASTGS